jgi:hypothetical protein
MAELMNPEAETGFTSPAPTAQAENGVTWTASEYVAHHKSAGWFLSVALVAAVIAALIYLLTHDFISTAVVVVGAVAFAMFGARPPRQLQYQVDRSGLVIGDKHLPYGNFRSFSVVPEGAFSSILFMPLKRFSMPLSIYFAPEDQEKIVAILSNQLPMENHRPDWIERFMQQIRF